MKNYFAFLFICVSPIIGFAQSNSTTEALFGLSNIFKTDYTLRKTEAIAKYNADANFSVRVADQKDITEIHSIGSNGVPVYLLSNSNLDAAKTTGTNLVWPNGILNKNLNGNGVKLGVWDGGTVRLTHQELVGRVEQGDSISSVNWHTTHVAGTMIGAGINPNAKGMAFGGKLKAYDWNLDLYEMTQEAANGMLLSNHSYGYIVGWRYYSTASISPANAAGWYWFGDTTISATKDANF